MDLRRVQNLILDLNRCQKIEKHQPVQERKAWVRALKRMELKFQLKMIKMIKKWEKERQKYDVFAFKLISINQSYHKFSFIILMNS